MANMAKRYNFNSAEEAYQAATKAHASLIIWSVLSGICSYMMLAELEKKGTFSGAYQVMKQIENAVKNANNVPKPNQMG